MRLLVSVDPLLNSFIRRQGVENLGSQRKIWRPCQMIFHTNFLPVYFSAPSMSSCDAITHKFFLEIGSDRHPDQTVSTQMVDGN